MTIDFNIMEAAVKKKKKKKTNYILPATSG